MRGYRCVCTEGRAAPVSLWDTHPHTHPSAGGAPEGERRLGVGRRTGPCPRGMRGWRAGGDRAGGSSPARTTIRKMESAAGAGRPRGQGCGQGPPPSLGIPHHPGPGRLRALGGGGEKGGGVRAPPPPARLVLHPAGAAAAASPAAPLHPPGVPGPGHGGGTGGLAGLSRQMENGQE